MKIRLPAQKEGCLQGKHIPQALERPASSGGCKISFQKPEFA